MAAFARAGCVRSKSSSTAWLQVQVTPNAQRNEVIGLREDALRVRLAAAPVDGKANERLCAWLAAELGLAKRQVVLARGGSARQKCLEIELPVGELQRWVDARLEVLPNEAD